MGSGFIQVNSHSRRKPIWRKAAGIAGLVLAFQGVSQIHQVNHPDEDGQRFLNARGYEVQGEGSPGFLFNGCSGFSRTYQVVAEEGAASEKTVCFLGSMLHFPDILQ